MPYAQQRCLRGLPLRKLSYANTLILQLWVKKRLERAVCLATHGQLPFCSRHLFPPCTYRTKYEGTMCCIGLIRITTQADTDAHDWYRASG